MIFCIVSITTESLDTRIHHKRDVFIEMFKIEHENKLSICFCIFLFLNCFISFNNKRKSLKSHERNVLNAWEPYFFVSLRMLFSRKLNLISTFRIVCFILNKYLNRLFSFRFTFYNVLGVMECFHIRIYVGSKHLTNRIQNTVKIIFKYKLLPHCIVS